MLAYLIVGDGRAQQLVTLFILESRGVIYFGVTGDVCGQRPRPTAKSFVNGGKSFSDSSNNSNKVSVAVGIRSSSKKAWIC